MPLGEFKTPDGSAVRNFGTNGDGSENLEYCTFCFQQGAFTNPDLTMESMIDLSVEFMSQNLEYSEEKAREMSRAIIPTLKRWQKTE